MRKIYLLVAGTALCMAALLLNSRSADSTLFSEEGEEKEGYDGALERDLLEFEKTKDPSLGYVPFDRLGDAIDYTEAQKKLASRSRASTSLSWEERGPIFDVTGPSNGNRRGTGGTNYTSGRIRAVLVDTLNDPTGNTVLAGGVSGGLWKCTNFLDEVPNWQAVNDYFSNLAIAAIAQDPTHPNIMYFATGEGTSNADAVLGKGVWKSTDAGATWVQLPSTAQFLRSFKMLVDGAGNVYLATRSLTAPIEQPYGLVRSKDGGATWENITPFNLTANTICTDIELSSTGRFHASFGYLGSIVNHRYTDNPESVSPAGGWGIGEGLRVSATPALRMEIAAQGDLLYAVTVNGAYNVDSCYRSVDGGATWTKQNTTVVPSGLGSGQGWYNLTLAISPNNPNEILSGGLDAYRSTNAGATWTRATYWVSSNPYVHADHHFMQWWNAGGETRVLIGCDGGLYLSRNNGVGWSDKNRNLSIKQFYSGAIHPAAGSPYLLAGAQDNGTHQINDAGLTSSVEVTGGDGAFVHINQLNPQIQFGAYVYNQYRRSTNGGQTWSSINFSNSIGLFINPFEYDDAQNILYASYGANRILRWMNAHNSTNNAAAFTIAELRRNNANSNATAFKVSPNTANRVFIGSSTGKVLRWENANSGDSAAISNNITDLTSPSFPTGFINCINVGSSDQYLVAVFTNYGVNNVWYSSNGGESWSAIDGNLPDMPVRWAIFHPQYNNRLILATEAGVYTTDAADGDNTKWKVDAGFPTVKTSMLKLRASDNTIVAATHGRGLWTAQLQMATGPEVNFVTNNTPVSEQSATIDGCRGYKDYTVALDILSAPNAATTVSLNVQGGNTARKGIDFNFTTNGSFSAPSDVVTFAAGVKERKTVTLRIYDDAEVEAAESFVLGFTVAGSDAIAGDVNTHTVTISDNDFAPVAVPTVQPFNVGDFNTQIIATSPFTGDRVKHRVQNLFTAAELKAAGVTRAGAIKSLTLNVLEKNSTKPFSGFTIRMANVSNSFISSYVPETTAFTTVFSANYTTVVGANTFTFTTPFVWDGTSNIVVNFCFDNGDGTVDRTADFLEGNSYPLGNGLSSTVYSNFTSGATAGCDLPPAFQSAFRINARFGVDFGINTVATALNTTSTQYLNDGNDIYYYSATGQIVARVRNLTAHNYACATVKIDRAGNGALPFWNNNKQNFLMSKTFQLSATTANPSGKYEVIFYFTKQEKEGYEAATGNLWNNIEMVKVSGRVSGVTPANAQPNNNGTVQGVIVPVRGTYGDGYTLKAVVEGSFSGFGFGNPGRQFNNVIVSTTTTGSTNQRTAAAPAENTIFWTPASLADVSHFDVEKSYDGVTFRKVATVKASGNSNYSYSDAEKTELNYFRVTLVYKDNQTLLSNTVLLRKQLMAKQEMFLLNNPFSTSLKVRFAKVPQTPIEMRLYDMQGKLVYSNRVAPAETAVFNIGNSGTLVSGAYLLDIRTDGERFQAKTLKQ